MTSRERWIAVVDAKGELVDEPEPYSGPEDDGCQEKRSTYGTSFQGIGSTKEEAIRAAEDCSEKSREVAKGD